MLKSLEYWLLCNLGAVAIILVGVNALLYAQNRSAQAAVNARAQYIQQTAPINDLHQQMAQALAQLAIKNHDDQVLLMLAGEGFRISDEPQQPPAKSAPASKGKP